MSRSVIHHARIGVHVNASEVYPEARRYDPEILEMHDGVPKNGWKWLDQSHHIDKRKDMIKGGITDSFLQMRRDLPELDFIYVDTYMSNGWPAWKLANLIESMVMPMYTEVNSALDPWTTWAHTRRDCGRIMRFIWFSHRDIFSNDLLLRGGPSTGFLGWRNQHDFNKFIASTFSVNLPSRYLMHHELLSWDPGREAIFSDGVAVRNEDGTVTVSQDGRKIMSWSDDFTNSRLFVPWNPLTAEKIYVWDEVGGEITWDLPDSWKQHEVVYLHKLTDAGRTEETPMSVSSGKVTLTPEKSTPYVLYPQAAPARKSFTFGEFSPVADPGFDSYGFEHWTITTGSPANIRIENDTRRNPRLIIAGKNGEAGSVTQAMSGLDPGKTYAASVWVQVTGERKATLAVEPDGGTPVSNYILKTEVPMRGPNSRWSKTRFHRVKVLFDMPTGGTSASITLEAGEGAPDTMVEFDDVRVVESGRAAEADKHWFYEDFEHVDMGYGPFTCCPGERTHLAETNKPFTEDTISGRFSLKTREKDNTTFGRTLPCTLRFSPKTTYKLTCKTLTAPDATGRIEARNGKNVLAKAAIPTGAHVVQMEFTTPDSADCYLALTKVGGDWLSIDEIAIGIVPLEDRRAD